MRSAADAVVTQAHQPTLPRTYMWFSAHDAPDIIAALVSPRVLRTRTLCVKNPTRLVPLTVVIPLYRPDGDPRKRDVARRFLLHPDRQTLSPLGLSLASSIRKAAKRENNAKGKRRKRRSISLHPPPHGTPSGALGRTVYQKCDVGRGPTIDSIHRARGSAPPLSSARVTAKPPLGAHLGSRCCSLLTLRDFL
jgi:hypothetical protein